VLFRSPTPIIISAVNSSSTMAIASALRTLLVLLFLKIVSSVQIPRPITIRNECGRRASVSWVSPDDGSLHLMSTPDIVSGADFDLKSFVTHKFEVKELPSKSTGECVTPGKCRVEYFIVSDNLDQVLTINKNFKIIHEDHKTTARKDASSLLEDCAELAKQNLQNTDAVAEAILAELAGCMEKEIANQLSFVADEIAFSAATRKKMGEYYENYTCADFDLPTSEPEELTTWFDSKRQITLDVEIMHDRPASRIHVVKNFITEEECLAMEEEAAPTLHRAVVADGAGEHKLSENRKAMQAGIKVPWEKEADGNHIAAISRRVYDYTNFVLNLNISEIGQEDLMSIQYFGRGENETKPDQYMPHCDGECTGDPHKYGNRMATMVMYCTIPTKGGATNFRNSGLHVHPIKGNAIFFSYINPETKIMDSGFTEHSGCPVVEGEKKIVTQWIRLGVTAEVPWTAYNSLGLLRKDTIDQDETVKATASVEPEQ